MVEMKLLLRVEAERIKKLVRRTVMLADRLAPTRNKIENLC